MENDANYRFALAVHSQEVANRVLECSTGFIDTAIHSCIISFDECVSEAKKLLAQGYEVILCHGGTGESIFREIAHSVVLIQKTDMDIVRSLCKAREISTEVALTVHVNESRDLEFMQDILGMKIHTICYSTKDELLQGVEEVYKKGVKVVLGGGPSRVAIEKLGGTGIIVEPNLHSVLQALQQACSTAKAKREESSNREQLIAILKLLDEGVVFVDMERNIVFSNSKAKQYLKLPARLPAGEQLPKHFDDLFLSSVLEDGRARLERIVTINKEKLVVNTLPVSIHSQLRGAVAMFRDTTSIQKITNLIHKELHLRGLTSSYTTRDIRGASPAVKRLIAKVEKYARNDSSILIEGETGTGKELVAHSLHSLSSRKDKPFVAVNCSALPESLLESELFGYEEGAFTGAKRGGKIGLFELANQGTIFLDEIGEISHAMQLRLLRVLEAKEIMRIGGDRIVPVNVRIVSASHRRLMDLVQQGGFRMDLYFRLGVLQLHVPPLRQRMEDIPLLVEDLWRQYGKKLDSLNQTMLATVSGYEWPGNIRELQSFFESYLILLGEEEVDEELFLEVFHDRAIVAGYVPPGEPVSPSAGTMKEQLDYFRRKIIQATLKQCLMNKQLASKRLGISYNTLWRILSGKAADAEE